jgi:beta-glucanase (GH16 family)
MVSKPSFVDNFDALSLSNSNSGVWQPSMYYSPSGSIDSPTMTSWMASPLAVATSMADANVFSVKAGILSIDIKPTPADVVSSSVGNAAFLGGELTTYQSYSQLYGYFEMRAQLASGPGLNSAFWLLPKDGSWPPELDVEEVLGNSPTTLIMTAHTGVSGSDSANPQWVTVPDTGAAFHTYGVDWEPSTITWYFDGKAVAQAPTPSDMNKPMYMIVDVMAGTSSSWMGAPKAGETAQMKIDYIRAYPTLPTDVLALERAGSIPPSSDAPAASVPVVAPSVPASPDTIDIAVSQDAYQGDAQFTVLVDGKQVGGVQTTHALHNAGGAEHIKLTGAWGSAAHNVQISFINDAWGGSTATDRNLYVDSIAYDGVVGAKTVTAFFTGGSKIFTVGGTTPAAASPADTLVLHLAEDAYQGDAQFQVFIDGKAVSTAEIVTALHATGKLQDFTFTGNFGTGPHDIGIAFLNDAWGGTAATDRNLHVESVDYNAQHLAGVSLFSAGTSHFAVTG